MRAIRFNPRVVALVFAIAFLWQATVASAAIPFSFQLSFLRGRWSFELVPAKSFATDAAGVADPGGLGTAPRQDVMRVGIMDFDGAGNVSGHSIATTDDNSGNTVVIDFTWQGTYALNADGTGTISIATLFIDDTKCTPAQPAGVCATLEGPETYSFSISKKYGTIALAQQDNPGGGAKIFLRGEVVRQSTGAVPLVLALPSLRRRWEFQMVPAKSFATDAARCGDAITNYSAVCDPAGLAFAPRQDILRVGNMNFDGGGGVTGHTIATTDDNAGNTVVIDMKQWVGTYAMNPDGTGTLNIVNPNVMDVDCMPAQLPPGTCATFEGPETYAFVYSKTRLRLYLIQTDNVGGGAKIFMRGEAQAQ